VNGYWKRALAKTETMLRDSIHTFSQSAYMRSISSSRARLKGIKASYPNFKYGNQLILAKVTY